MDDQPDMGLTYPRASIEDEARHLLPPPLPESILPAITTISTLDLANLPPSPSTSDAHYNALLSLTISRISSIGTALGFLSGVSVLALLIIPVTMMGGTTSSLRVAVGASAIWWAVFTIPAWRGLPGRRQSTSGATQGATAGLTQGWKRVGKMVTPSEIRSLPNLFTFLLAWIFLSDGTSSFQS
jgi:UMF1 family MFS transporter